MDLLNCYYAHAEDSILFQRRAYWLLDSVDSEVVLVHYLEVHKGSGSARILGATERNSPGPRMTIPTDMHNEKAEITNADSNLDSPHGWHGVKQPALVNQASNSYVPQQQPTMR